MAFSEVAEQAQKNLLDFLASPCGMSLENQFYSQMRLPTELCVKQFSVYEKSMSGERIEKAEDWDNHPDDQIEEPVEMLTNRHLLFSLGGHALKLRGFG